MTSTEDIPATEPLRQRIPATVAIARARRRIATVLGIVLAVIAVQVAVQASLDSADTDWVFLLIDVPMAMIAWMYLRGLAVARGDAVQHGPDGRYVTARTRSGARTIDITNLRRVGSRRVHYRFAFTFRRRMTVRDAAGVRMAFDDAQSWQGIKKAVQAADPAAIRVTTLARHDLGLTNDDGFSGLHSLLAFFEPLAAGMSGLVVLSLTSAVV